MSGVERPLHLVPPDPTGGGTGPREVDDVGLTAMIFLVSALPLASAMAGVGRWGQASLGLATVGAVLAGRELCAWLVGRCWRRRRP
jgi:hypothetical protein